MTLLNDEQRRLREKMNELVRQEKCLEEKEEKLDDLRSKLEQEKVKV